MISSSWIKVRFKCEQTQDKSLISSISQLWDLFIQLCSVNRSVSLKFHQEGLQLNTKGGVLNPIRLEKSKRKYCVPLNKNLIMRPSNNYHNTTDCTLSSTQEGTGSEFSIQPAEKTLQEDKYPLITLTLSKSSSRTRIDSSFLWAIKSFLSSIPIFSAISSSSVSPIFRRRLAFLFSSLKINWR